ncbi:MAG: hypothetical protein Q9218_003943, partial [Villophora microphyllina]
KDPFGKVSAGHLTLRSYTTGMSIESKKLFDPDDRLKLVKEGAKECYVTLDSKEDLRDAYSGMVVTCLDVMRDKKGLHNSYVSGSPLHKGYLILPSSVIIYQNGADRHSCREAGRAERKMEAKTGQMADATEKSEPEPIPYLRLMLDHSYIPPSIKDYRYSGSGTETDPYLIEWVDDDPRNPMLTAQWKKWLWTCLESLTCFSVAIATSGYSAGPNEILARFGMSREVYEFGFSVFVLGFALGPLLWAPLTFNAACIVVPDTAGLVLMRFIKGSFGSSLLANAGGVVADIFEPKHRGLGIVVFSTAPLLGPVLGPVFGGLISQHAGFQWLEGYLTILSGTLWIIVTLTVPETYTPLLLERRAQRLTRTTGKHHVSKLSKGEQKSLAKILKTALTRPWVLLFREPIVLLFSIYMAVLSSPAPAAIEKRNCPTDIFLQLYVFFAAFPIVFSQHRGWDETFTGLAFLGIGVGVLLGIVYSFPDHARYQRLLASSPTGDPGPEARLPPSLVGCIAIPIGIFWFAWTVTPAIHYMVPIAGSVLFGFGFVLVYLASQNYLVDSYTIYAASVLAANTLMRSALGAVFPLFTTYMYDNLGINWASTVPAFLATACVPFPFLFWKYGARIRERCKYAAEAERMRVAAFGNVKA